MATLEEWQAAWEAVQGDRSAGRISQAQFMKERSYLFAARRQIIERSK